MVESSGEVERSVELLPAYAEPKSTRLRVQDTAAMMVKRAKEKWRMRKPPALPPGTDTGGGDDDAEDGGVEVGRRVAQPHGDSNGPLAVSSASNASSRSAGAVRIRGPAFVESPESSSSFSHGDGGEGEGRGGEVLVEATVVEDVPLVEARQVKYSRRWIVGGVVLLVSVVGLVVGLSVRRTPATLPAIRPREENETQVFTPAERAMLWLREDPRYSTYPPDRRNHLLALASLYYSTNGREILTEPARRMSYAVADSSATTWLNDTGWLSFESSECTWHGISCNEHEHVIGISLANNGLVQTLYHRRLLGTASFYTANYIF